jgi:hypothetical protein
MDELKDRRLRAEKTRGVLLRACGDFWRKDAPAVAFATLEQNARIVRECFDGKGHRIACWLPMETFGVVPELCTECGHHIGNSDREYHPGKERAK